MASVNKDSQTPVVAPSTAAAAANESATRNTKKKKKRSKQKKRTLLENITPDGDVPVSYYTSQALGRFVAATKSVQAGEVLLRDSSEFGHVTFSPEFCTICTRSCVTTQSSSDPDWFVNATVCERGECRLKYQELDPIESPLLHKANELCTKADVDVNLFRIVVRLIATRIVAVNNNKYENVWETLIDPLVTNMNQLESSWIQSACELFSLAMPFFRLQDIKSFTDHTFPIETNLPSGTPEANLVNIAVCLAAKVNSNAYSILVYNQDASPVTRGIALLPHCGILQHDCRPNSHWLWEEGRGAVIRALRPISQGECVSVSYVDPLQDARSRQQELLTTKFFICKCDRCLQPSAQDKLSEAIVAIRASEKHTSSEYDCLIRMAPENREDGSKARQMFESKLVSKFGDNEKVKAITFYYAPQSQDIFSEGFVNNWYNTVKTCIDDVQQVLQSSTDDNSSQNLLLESYLTQYHPHFAPDGLNNQTRLMLHPSHVLNVDALLMLANIFFRMNEFDKAYFLFREVSTVQKGLLPPAHPLMTLLLHTQAMCGMVGLDRGYGESAGIVTPKLQRRWDSNKVKCEVLETLQEVLDMRIFCFGKDHPCVGTSVKDLEDAKLKFGC